MHFYTLIDIRCIPVSWIYFQLLTNILVRPLTTQANLAGANHHHHFAKHYHIFRLRRKIIQHRKAPYQSLPILHFELIRTKPTDMLLIAWNVIVRPRWIEYAHNHTESLLNFCSIMVTSLLLNWRFPRLYTNDILQTSSHPPQFHWHSTLLKRRHINISFSSSNTSQFACDICRDHDLWFENIVNNQYTPAIQ